MAMVQLATADTMVIEFVWDEKDRALRPSEQLQKLPQDEHITKVTWGTEFSEGWPELAALRGVANIQPTKGQVGETKGDNAPASLKEGLSHACNTAAPSTTTKSSTPKNP